MERALEVLEGIGVKPLGLRAPSADLLGGDAPAGGGARLPLRLEPDGRRLPAVPPPHRRPGRARRAARARARVDGLGAALSFELDDWVHFQFNFDPYRKGGATASDVLEIWLGELDWMDANVDGGILTDDAHPQVIGRGHRMAMLETFVDRCREAGARFERMGDVAQSLT